MSVHAEASRIVRAAPAGWSARRFGAAVGIGFALTQVLGAVVLGTAGRAPNLGDGAGWSAYLARHATAYEIDAWLFAASAALFLIFAEGLGEAVELKGAAWRPAGRQLRAFGLAWSTLVTVSAGCLAAAALVAPSSGDAAAGLAALGSALFGTIGLLPMIGLMIVTSVAALRTRVLPGWVAVLGLVTAVANLVSTFAVLVPVSGGFFAVGGLSGQILGGFAYIAWALGVSIGCLTGSPESH